MSSWKANYISIEHEALATTRAFERAAKCRLWVKFLTSLPPLAFALGLKGWWLLLQSPWTLNVSFLSTKPNCVLMSTRNLSLTFDWPMPEFVFLWYCLKVSSFHLLREKREKSALKHTHSHIYTHTYLTLIKLFLLHLSPFVYSYVSYKITLTDEETSWDFPQDVKYFLLLKSIVSLRDKLNWDFVEYVCP